MSDDEKFVLFISGVIALVVWPTWFVRILRITSLGTSPSARLPVLAAPWVCAGLLFAVLKTGASHDVRDDAGYLFFYQVLGAAWVALAALWIRRLGLSVRDDVAERRNPAAAWAIAGALVGLTLAFAGSNIGDGPGWWVVAFTGGLATAAFMGLWSARERVERVAESIVVERDLAAGLRFGGWLVAIGLVLGRAAAGDWTGPGAAVVDFLRLGWPAVVLTLFAVALEPRLKATPRVPRPSWAIAGALPAALFVGAAASWAIWTRPLS